MWTYLIERTLTVVVVRIHREGVGDGGLGAAAGAGNQFEVEFILGATALVALGRAHFWLGCRSLQ